MNISYHRPFYNNVIQSRLQLIRLNDVVYNLLISTNEWIKMLLIGGQVRTVIVDDRSSFKIHTSYNVIMFISQKGIIRNYIFSLQIFFSFSLCKVSLK